MRRSVQTDAEPWWPAFAGWLDDLWEAAADRLDDPRRFWTERPLTVTVVVCRQDADAALTRALTELSPLAAALRGEWVASPRLEIDIVTVTSDQLGRWRTDRDVRDVLRRSEAALIVMDRRYKRELLLGELARAACAVLRGEWFRIAVVIASPDITAAHANVAEAVNHRAPAAARFPIFGLAADSLPGSPESLQIAAWLADHAVRWHAATGARSALEDLLRQVRTAGPLAGELENRAAELLASPCVRQLELAAFLSRSVEAGAPVSGGLVCLPPDRLRELAGLVAADCTARAAAVAGPGVGLGDLIDSWRVPGPGADSASRACHRAVREFLECL
ncbi:hypothetical protein [Frankia sp. CiP3]|uniref:hypothetical protein n=1 Tax=Frankia sp. CiP3 TaxID=2880971 RepID=UPI001EF3E20E|nr:hypothetical protein [Frankia sp. CiP3]